MDSLLSTTFPSFSEDLRSWESFRDMYLVLIDVDEFLDDVQRLHYLKRSLTGDAGLVLRNTTVTSANYKTASANLKSILDLIKVRKEISLADLKLLRD